MSPTKFPAFARPVPIRQLGAAEIVARAIRDVYPGRIAVVSSFGTEAAVLLHLVARVDRSVPVIFLDTGKHFPETLAYRDTLIRRLGLTDVRTLIPSETDLVAEDPEGDLWRDDPDACCAIRKVRPLTPAVAGFEAIVSGRKRHHGAGRRALGVIEAAGPQIAVNPLVDWGPRAVALYMAKHGLPPHPLQSQGYPSIGCAVCTSPAAAGEDFRAGRWRGRSKTECGIHFPDRPT